MAEMDKGTENAGEEKQEKSTDASVDTSKTASTPDSDLVRHYQSLADRRGAKLTALETELNNLKQAQSDAETKELQEKEQFKTLYEKAQAELDTASKALATLELHVETQKFLNENHPDYAADFDWIKPHVASSDDIASVVEKYVKAHPKSKGVGAASMGNRGTESEGVKTIPAEHLDDPDRLLEYEKEDPDFLLKLQRGEIKVQH